MTTPDPSSATPAGWDNQPPSAWSRVRDTAATLPKGAGIGAAYRAGKQLGAEQFGSTHWGNVTDAASHGTMSSGDSGPGDYATSDQLQEHADQLNGRMDELAGSIGSMQGGGGQASPQNSNLQGLTPSRMPARPPEVSPLRQGAMDQMAAGNQQLASTRANFSARFAARQAQGGMAAVQPTGNGMGQTTQEATMSGALRGNGMRSPTGNGQSQSSFEKSRFGQ
jgi:hypothetical protein